MKQIVLWARTHLSLLVVIFLAILAGLPLLHTGLIPTHDGEYHLIRFYEFDKVLRSGSLYPRWAPDLDFGYGVPLLTYVYPLPNYAASLFHFLGASFLDSVKLNMFVATLVGAIFCYFWTKKFWGNVGGAISSVSYTFAPYHFVDMYVRGSVGEVWALALFPAFLWAYTEFSQTNQKRFIFLASIFFAMIIFSHNILGLMFAVFSFSYCVLLIVQSQSKKYLLLTTCYILLTGLGLSSIFWIPALFETQYVTGLQIYAIFENFTDLSQLLFPSWGTGFFGTTGGNVMSVQIGVANLFAVCIGIFVFFNQFKKERVIASYIAFFLAWFFLLVFFMLPYSLSLWNALPLMHYFQFPWRFLSLTILVCAFLSGSIIHIPRVKILGTIFIIFIILTTIGYTTPAYYMQRSDTYYTTRSNFINSTNSPGNIFNTIWNTPKTTRPNEFFIKNAATTILRIEKKSPTSFTAIVSSTTSHTQVVAISYFPNWHVSIDSKSTQAFPTDGLLSFRLPRGRHAIQIVFQQTPLETFASLTTVGSIILLAIRIFLLRKRAR